MGKINIKTDISDIYFIFADNIYEKYLTYDNFKALLNFYALLYGKVIIPDAFFINNSHLRNLFIKDNGIEYVKEGIIVPSIRENAKSLLDLYKEFDNNGTLIDTNEQSITIQKYLEQIDNENRITWKIESISGNFTQNIIENIGKINIHNDDILRWESYVHDMKSNGNITRLALRNSMNSLNFQDDNTGKIINNYIDIIYNFNIPNFLGTSVGYPEQIFENNVFSLSPKEIFFDYKKIKNNFDSISNDEEILESYLFDIGILQALSAEKIKHIRNLSQYKNFVKTYKSAGESKAKDKFIDYMISYNDEIKKIIINDSNGRLQGLESKLKFYNLGRDSLSGDGVSFLIDIVMDGISSFAAGKLLGKAVQIMTKPITKEIERDISKIKFKGEKKINDLRTNENILDSLKSFGIATVKQCN